MFRLKDEFYFTNEKGKVVAVDGGLDDENRNIVMEQRKEGVVGQRWRVVYVDEYEGEPTKGQLNKKFGLYVERDFYVVSAIGNKYLDILNNRYLAIKTHVNSRKTQVFYFHQQSMTVRTRYNNQSW